MIFAIFVLFFSSFFISLYFHRLLCVFASFVYSNALSTVEKGAASAVAAEGKRMELFNVKKEWAFLNEIHLLFNSTEEIIRKWDQNRHNEHSSNSDGGSNSERYIVRDMKNSPARKWFVLSTLFFRAPFYFHFAF